MPDNSNVVGQAAIAITADFSTFAPSLNKGLAGAERTVNSSFSSMGATVSNLARTVGMAFGVGGGIYAAVSVLKNAAAEAVKFDASMANVGTLLIGSGVSARQMSAEILKLNGNLGSSAELADALYESLSAGVEPAKAIAFVGTATKLAKAELFDAGSAAKLLATVMNAYGREVTDVNHVSDVFVETINAGIVRGDELAGALGRVIPAASSAGVSIEELGAAIAIMTRTGLSADESATSLNRAILSFISPSKEAKKVASELGFELSAQRLQHLGLKGAIEEATKATKGNLEAQAALFGDERGFRAALALTGAQAKDFTKILDDMKTKAGQTTAAFDVQQNSIKGQWSAAWNNAQRIMDDFANKSSGVVVDGLKAVNGFLTGQIDLAKQLGDVWLIAGNNVADYINKKNQDSGDALAKWLATPESRARTRSGNFLSGFLGGNAVVGAENFALSTTALAAQQLKALGGQDLPQGQMSAEEWRRAVTDALKAMPQVQALLKPRQAQSAAVPSGTPASGVGGPTGLSDELKELRDAFIKAEAPANALNIEIDDLVKSGISLARILVTDSDEVVKAADAQLAHGVALTGTTRLIALQAFEIEKIKNAQKIASDLIKAHPLTMTTAPLVESNQARLDEEIRKSSLEAKDRFEQAQADGTFRFPVIFEIDPTVVFRNPILTTAANALVDLEQMKAEAMSLEESLGQLRDAGHSDAQIFAVLDGVIRSATKNAALFGIELGPMTAELIAMQAAAEANAEAAKKWQQIWSQAVAQTVSSFSQAFTDLVFGFGRVTDSINAAKDALASLQQQLDRRKADFSASLESDAIETELEEAQKAYDASQRVGKLLPTVTSGGTAGDARADAALDVLRAKQLRDSETAQTIAAYNRLRDAKKAKDDFEKRERARAIAQERADIATLEREVKAAADRVLTHLGAFASAVKGIFAQLGKSILEIMVTGVFTQIAAGLSKILTDFAGQNTGILGSIAGGLAKVFGAGKGAASAAGTAAGAAGTAAGVGAGAAGAGAGAGAGGAGGGGIGSSIGAFASNPITIAVAGAIATALIVKHFVGQGRRAANEFVQGAQDPFTGSVDDLAAIFDRQAKAGTLTVESAQKARDAMQALYTNYKATGEDFARQGSDQAKVWNQAKATLNANYGAGLSKIFDSMESTISTLKAEGKTDAAVKPGGVGIPETGLANSASRLFSDAVTRLIKGMDAIVKSIVPAPAVVVQQAASGGFVRKGGLVQLHAGEVIQPPAQLNPMYLLRSFIPRMPDLTRGLSTGVPAMASASGGNVSMPITQNLTFNLNGHELNRTTTRNVIIPEVLAALETGVYSYRERLSKIVKPHLGVHEAKSYPSGGQVV